MGCTPSVVHRAGGTTSVTSANDETGRNSSPAIDEPNNEDDSRGFLHNHQRSRQNKDEGDGAVVANKSWKNRKIPTSASGDKDGLESKRPSTNRSMQDIRFGPMFHSQQGPMKVLLVFGKEDAQSDAFWTAAEKLGHECCLVKTAEAALDAFQDKGHNVIIVDVRHSKYFDGEELCRSIRNTKWSQHTVIVAVVKRSLAEREDSSVLPLLKAGFTRWFVESHSVGVCLNELVQLQHSEVHPRVQLATAQALYVALDKCKDLVHVTDSSHNLQYLNRASERLLGYRTEELVGRNLLEMHQAESVEVMMQQLHRGHEWEGWLNCKRKTGDTVSLSCRIIPTCVAGRSPTHFVYIQEPPPLLADKALSDTGQSDGYPLPRGSLRSLRKGSYDIKSLNSDVGSQAIRRQSLAKLHSLTIEAPITRVITLIYAAQENSPPQVAQILDKVVEILRTTELYSPQLMQEEKTRTDDPVATDLIGALLSQGPKPLSGARRSSSESAVRRELHQGPRASLPPSHAPVQLKELLDTAFHWEFDIFQLEDLTNTRPLVWLGMNLMCHFDVTRTLGCDESTLQNWLTIIEANYHSDNSYHNSTHAADVLQATACFLERERMKQILDPVDEATCLIAAAVHDVDHPGKSSAFLCNSSSDLAILYNDLSVLESHHSALTFKLTMSDDRVNIFKGLETDMYKVVRQSVIDMVLATEMTKHFEHMSKFVNVFTKPAMRDDENYGEAMCDSPDISLLTAPENIALVKRMLIKCADVSNPTRPLRLSVEWAKRIAEEYFNQTDEEKLNGLPVVMPVFDRLTCSIPRSQIGFVEYIINDMFEAWEAFIDMPELLQYLKGNYQFWKEKEAQGITSIQDFATVQDTIEEHDEGRTEIQQATNAAGSK